MVVRRATFNLNSPRIDCQSMLIFAVVVWFIALSRHGVFYLHPWHRMSFHSLYGLERHAGEKHVTRAMLLSEIHLRNISSLHVKSEHVDKKACSAASFFMSTCARVSAHNK